MSIRVLVTGANGLLGQKLVKLIGNTPGYELIATGTGKNRLPDGIANYTYVTMNVTNREEVESVIAECAPAHVIHTAAMTNVDQCETERDECWELNVRAVEYIVEACRRNKIHLVHLSTDFIFDGEAGPYDEEAKAAPISFYGSSKLAAERVVFKAKMDWCVLRTVLVYGLAHDMSRSNIVLWVKKSLEEGRKITVVNDQWRTPTLAEDLAMGCFLAVQKRALGVYNISGEELYSPYQMAIKTGEFFGLDTSLITEGNSLTFTQPAKRPPRTGFIITKAKTELGYTPHTFEQGLALLAEQLKASVSA